MRAAALAALALTACGGSSPSPAPRKPLAPDHQLYYATDRHDRYMCSAPESAVVACGELAPASADAGCRMMPPVAYWDGEPTCSGVDDEDDADAAYERERERRDARRTHLPVPLCQCSCDAAYRADLDAYEAKLRTCASRS